MDPHVQPAVVKFRP